MAQSGDTSQIKFATGTSTADGDYGTPLVAAVTGKKIRVIALSASVVTTAGSLSFKGTGSLTGTVFQLTLAIGSPFVQSTNSPLIGLFETASGEGITPTNGSGVDSFINATYVEVTP